MSIELVTVLLSAAASAGGAWIAVKVALAVMANDIQWIKDSIARAHGRIDEVENSLRKSTPL